MSKLYQLEHDYDHSGDSEKDAFHLPFKGDDKISTYFSNPEMYSKELLPVVIYFQANFAQVPKYDFPLTDLIIPVMSLRMIKSLEETMKFDYDEISVVMIDDTYPDKLFDETGRLKRNIHFVDSYKAIRLLKCESFFDYEKSQYRPSRSNPEIPGVIKKVVVKEPMGGFPPIFRMDRLSSNLYVSKEAKEALEAANIKGCVFEPVETS